MDFLQQILKERTLRKSLQKIKKINLLLFVMLCKWYIFLLNVLQSFVST